MSTLPRPVTSIRRRLSSSDRSRRRFLWGRSASVAMDDLVDASGPAARAGELTDRSILLLTRDQLAAALALVELDGLAKRIVICPPEISPEQFPALIEKAGVDTVVSDEELPDLACFAGLTRLACSSTLAPRPQEAGEDRPTEWVLLTSGTTSAPKMIAHTLASLTGALDLAANDRTGSKPAVVWGTFYDIRRYGGLQIFLRAVMGSGSLVLSSAGETAADHLMRLARHGVTRLSGTPSHWRRALMSPEAHRIAPEYVRLSGEIADQAVLNTLRSFYPAAQVGHAFASTEAGVAFEVNDGLAGFPAELLGSHAGVEMRVCHDSLQIRSSRTASRYLGGENGALADDEGFVDTGDMVERRGDRYYFLGRRNGVINVGGLKVYPEEVEAVINRHPAVRMSAVRSRKNPITGALVSADVMLKEAAPEGNGLADEILAICRESLAPHKIPATVRYVASLDVAAAGKLVRHHA